MSFEGIGNSVHLIAAVLWIGGLGLLSIAVAPVAQRVLGEEAQEKLRAALHRVVIPMSFAGIVLLGGTGLMMLTQDTHFHGWGHYENWWSRLMVVKHVLYVGMIATTIVIWRMTKERSRKELLDLCFYLGVAVLILTGFITSVPD